MRVLVCGDRWWGRSIDGVENARTRKDQHLLNSTLSKLHQQHRFTVLIEGEAKGADTLARLWAEANRVHVDPYPANWETFGRAAGPIRNRQMLVVGKPELVVAFHRELSNSKGTRNMVQQAQRVGVRTLVFPLQKGAKP